MGSIRSKEAEQYVSVNSMLQEGPKSHHYSSKSWMARIDDEMPLMDLVLPGTHNSATYLTKNFLFMVKDYMAC